MAPVRFSGKEAERISAIREFNRFYTVRLGLLQKRHLGGEFSLTEARILYEIGSSPSVTASTLRSTLGLDGGYISRILSLLTKRKLVRQTPSRQDGREKLLTLSAQGRKAVGQLNEQSSLQIRELLETVSAAKRDTLVESFSQAHSILREAAQSVVRIVRISELNADAKRLLQEYYEAVHVVQRDTLQDIRKILDDPSSGIWLAYLEGNAVGCVMLKRLPSIPLAGECKRLYVQPAARGRGIAGKLLDVQEDFARGQGLQSIYLDTYDGLKTAIALYRKRGFVPCERYNDNPQATIFLRKEIE